MSLSNSRIAIAQQRKRVLSLHNQITVAQQRRANVPEAEDEADEEPDTQSTNEKNLANAWGSKLKMNFAVEDAADDFLLNEVIWKSVRGVDSVMPAPVHAAFFMGRKPDDD